MDHASPYSCLSALLTCAHNLILLGHYLTLTVILKMKHWKQDYLSAHSATAHRGTQFVKEDNWVYNYSRMFQTLVFIVRNTTGTEYTKKEMTQKLTFLYILQVTACYKDLLRWDLVSLLMLSTSVEVASYYWVFCYVILKN